MKKPLIGLKQHIVGNRKAIALKVDGRQIQVIILNSAWKDNYHLILEEIEGMTAIKTAHLVVDKKELLKELADDSELLLKITNKLSYPHIKKLTDLDLAAYMFSGYILKILDEVKKETKDV